MVKKKGQMSLEMIIGLVILLVVAGVVIAMLLTYLNKSSMPNVDKELDKRGFKNKCEELCQQDIVSYCSYYYGKETNAQIDLNGDNQFNSLVQVGSQNWYACESRLYCFLYYPCRRFGTSKNAMERCAKILCDNALNKYSGLQNSIQLANQEVHEMITPGSEVSGIPYCPLLENVPYEKNWYARFFPDDVCGTKTGGNQGAGTSGYTLSNCVLNKTKTPWGLTCDTTCKEADVVVVKDSLGDKAVEITPLISGGKLISTPLISGTANGLEKLKCPEVWTVFLTCSNPVGVKQTALVCQ